MASAARSATSVVRTGFDGLATSVATRAMMENLLNTANAILITGPTASGKSALAVELAKRHNGVVINADSMQVYDTLSVLTARPSQEDMQGVPHHLYGHVPAGAS